MFFKKYKEAILEVNIIKKIDGIFDKDSKLSKVYSKGYSLT